MAPAVTIESIGAGGVIQDNESGADHAISGTGEAGRLVELAFPTDDDPTASHIVTTMVQADGSWSYTLNNDDMIVIGQGAGRSVVATRSMSRGMCSLPRRQGLRCTPTRWTPRAYSTSRS